MTTMLDRTGARGAPVQVATGRYEWERIVRRICGMSDPVARLAFTLSSYADPDGSRIRPGEPVLAADTDKSVRTVRRLLGELTDRYGLIQLVARGGGRGGFGRTSTYRLTIPTDLLDRVNLRPIGADSPDIQVSGHSADSGDIIMSGQSEPDPVDNSESPDTQMSPQSRVDNPIDRTHNDVSNGLTGHLAPIDRTPCMADYQPHTNHQRPTTGSPTNATTDRTQPAGEDPPTPRLSLDEIIPPGRPPKRPPGPRCRHGLAPTARTDGTPRCPLCRRQPPPEPP
jgi:hypothetical protein